MYWNYIKELHKFACKQSVYNDLISTILFPMVYIAFIFIMSLDYKAYKKFKTNNY